jgi:HlyD family secretion protein
MRRILASIVLLLLAAAAAVGLTRLRRPGQIALPTSTVVRTTFVDYLQLRGEIRPVKSTILAAPMSGGSDLQIIQLAKNGSLVNAGDVVVQFDTTVQQRTLEQKRSELKQADAEIDRVLAEQRRREQTAQTALEQARSALDRARLDVETSELRPRVEIEKLRITAANAEHTVRELEQKALAERASAAADVASARQKRDKASFDVKDSERLIAGMTLRAPRPGPITVLPNRRAATIFAQTAPEFRAGDRAFFGAAIVELPDLSSVEVTCHIDEIDRSRVQTGRATLVRVDALPDRELKGAVRTISVMARPDFSNFPPTRNFDLVVALADNDARLRSGMSATARIEMDHLQNVLVVPAGAVFHHGGLAVAYVVNGSTIEERRVSVLRRGRDQTVIANGLRENERVTLKEPDADVVSR